MGRSHAETFQSLRADVLDRLVTGRASIDQGYAAVDEETVRGQFDVVLGKMASYLATEDADAFRSFVMRWAAMRGGAGFGPENIVHSVVAIGDVVRRVAHRRLGISPETADFARSVTAASILAARALVDDLADELAQRSAELRVLEEA